MQLRFIMNKLFYTIIIQLLLLFVNCTENRDPSQLAFTPSGLMNQVEGSRYFEDLKTIAIDRTLLSPGHDMVRDLCANRLAELGFKVEMHSYGTGINVIGRLEGRTKPGEIVLLSAHYDSRNAGCPGADDNASGVAGVLEAARVLSKAGYERTLIIALWDEEEIGLKTPRGLVGSRAFAAKARSEGMNIVLAIVFEMIGYRSTEPGSQKFPVWIKPFFPEEMKKVAANGNRGDFICLTVNEDAKAYADIYAGFASATALPSLTLNVRRKIIHIHDFRRSDHAAFWEKGYSAMMIGDTINYRNNRYHCKNGKVDDVSSLDTDFTRDTIKATVATMAKILGMGI
jgi:Zn-dependent M28 family amino/carboxypeptidase